MYYHVADGAITADSQGWRFGTRNGVCFRNDIYNYESWPALGVNGILIWEEYDQQGNLVDYWEAEQQPFDTWYFLPWRRWNRTVYATNTWNNISYIEEFHTNDIVTIDLVTDGTPGVNGQRLWRLEAAANDSTTGQPIPPNQITLLGKTALATNWYGDWYPYTNIGVVYKVLSDNTVVDATPTIPRESITYDVKAFPARLLIKWDNTDVTDKTNVVWVGEKIHLACSLSSQIAIITNFQWTVPGKRLANWDVAADDRYARTHPLTGTNGPTVQFHWVLDETGTVDVTCKVHVEGETLTAKTIYEIRRPTATWNLYPQDWWR